MMQKPENVTVHTRLTLQDYTVHEIVERLPLQNRGKNAKTMFLLTTFFKRNNSKISKGETLKAGCVAQIVGCILKLFNSCRHLQRIYCLKM